MSMKVGNFMHTNNNDFIINEKDKKAGTLSPLYSLIKLLTCFIYVH